jgi:hypothetical protein
VALGQGSGGAHRVRRQGEHVRSIAAEGVV